MQPTLLSISGFEIHSIVVFMIIGFIVLAFLLWKNLRDLITRNSIFDIVVFTLIISPLIGRLVYLFKHFSSYLTNGWNLLPVRDTIGGVAFFDTAPWNFFAIWDGGTYFHFIPIAFFVAIYLSLSISRQKVLSDKIIPRAWMSFIPAYIIIIVAFLLDGSYLGKPSPLPIKVLYEGENEARLAVQIIEIIVLLVIAIFYVDMKSRPKLLNLSRAIIFPLIWSASEVLLWFKVEQYQEDLFIFDVVQLIWIVAFGIYFILIGYQGIKIKSHKGEINQENKLQQANRASKGSFLNKPNRKYQRNISQQGISWTSKHRFNNDFSKELSMGERLKKTKNRLRRGI